MTPAEPDPLLEALAGEVDRLYQLPLGDFVASRDELVKRLRAEGDRERAAAVKRLAKPSVSAWTVNRLHQLEPTPFRDLLAAGDALRRAQQEGLGLAAFQQALTARQEAQTRLLARAAELLANAGHASSAGTLLRVTKTLEALSVYGSAVPGPAPGRMSDDLEPPGIEGLTAFGVAPAPSSSRAAARPALVPPRASRPALPPANARQMARAVTKAKQELEAARKRLAERRRAARAASDKATRATAAEEKAKEQVRAAERTLGDLRQRLAAAEELRAARDHEAAEAHAELRRAQEAVDEAQSQLDSLAPRPPTQ